MTVVPNANGQHRALSLQQGFKGLGLGGTQGFRVYDFGLIIRRKAFGDLGKTRIRTLDKPWRSRPGKCRRCSESFLTTFQSCAGGAQGSGSGFKVKGLGYRVRVYRVLRRPDSQP